MNERIKKLRKVLDITQQEFADKIGMKRNTIANYETDRNEPSNSVVSLICKTFNVSETWLRTGEGEMFVPAPTDALDTFIRERNLSPSDRVLIEKFASLDDRSRQAVVEYVLSAADELLKNSAATPVAKDTDVPATDGTGPERTGVDITAELAELKRQNEEIQRQNQELAAKVAAMEEEDAAHGLMDVSSASPSESVGSFDQPAQSAKK